MKQILLTSCLALVLTGCAKSQDDALLQAARDAHRWIGESAIETATGISWPAVPDVSSDVAPDLYSGSAGVVLFLLELHRATGDDHYLTDARRGADHLVDLVSEIDDPGLYTGLAGIGFVLLETYEVTGARHYLDAVHLIVNRLATEAHTIDGGVAWNDVTDIISGSAGIGLFLLDASNRTHDEQARKLAMQCGERLLDLAQDVPMGLRWEMTPDYPREMPNFSHGTAGAAFFLARLFEETGNVRFLNAATEGARYLSSLSERDGLICHHVPGGEELFYLGWCHGPPGTLRLYHLLTRITGDEAYAQHINLCADTLLHSGIPTAQTDGFWNNVGQCCGSAGVAELYIDLYSLHRDPRHLEFAEQIAADVLARATKHEQSQCWIHAEHRVQPDLLQAQTGYMQGAAGIGMMLLHLREAKAGRFEWIRLPDSPFVNTSDAQ